MYFRKPPNELDLLTCRKCGTPQESPGSTVCEHCGADLARPRSAKPSSKRPVRNLKQFLYLPAYLLRQGITALLLLVSLTLRVLAQLGLVATLVIGVSFVPEVNASVPETKELALVARQWFQNAQTWSGELMASWGVVTPQQTALGPKHTRTQIAPNQAILIASTPAGATVLLGTRRVGRTPMTLRVAVGTYKLTITRPGYITITRTINVKQGKGISVGVTLVPANPPVVPATQPPTTQPSREPGDGTEQRPTDRQPADPQSKTEGS